jgi:hypothetical protein
MQCAKSIKLTSCENQEEGNVGRRAEIIFSSGFLFDLVHEKAINDLDEEGIDNEFKKNWSVFEAREIKHPTHVLRMKKRRTQV